MTDTRPGRCSPALAILMRKGPLTEIRSPAAAAPAPLTSPPRPPARLLPGRAGGESSAHARAVDVGPGTLVGDVCAHARAGSPRLAQLQLQQNNKELRTKLANLFFVFFSLKFVGRVRGRRTRYVGLRLHWQVYRHGIY